VPEGSGGFEARSADAGSEAIQTLARRSASVLAASGAAAFKGQTCFARGVAIAIDGNSVPAGSIHAAIAIDAARYSPTPINTRRFTNSE
jgi:hypothetical protein